MNKNNKEKYRYELLILGKKGHFNNHYNAASVKI